MRSIIAPRSLVKSVSSTFARVDPLGVGGLAEVVVLLDLSMPRRTGLDALPEIKRVAPQAKVIVLSGFAAPMLASDVLALESDAHP